MSIIKAQILADQTNCTILESYLQGGAWHERYEMYPDEALGKEIIVKLDHERHFKAPVRLGDVLDYLGFLLRREDKAATALVRLCNGVLNPATSMFINSNGHDIRLTEKEVEILLCLHARGGGVIARLDLLHQLWGYVDGVETHTLETHMYRLRQKIESDPSAPVFLITEENGYSLCVF